MKKIITVVLLAFVVICSCCAEEFKGFLGIPFGSSKAYALTTMNKKGWDFRISDSKTYHFFGKQYAGKDVDEIMFTFQGDLLQSVVVVVNHDDALEIFNAMSRKYEFIYFEGTPYYASSDKKAVFSLIDGGLVIIDGSILTQPKSTMESDI